MIIYILKSTLSDMFMYVQLCETVSKVSVPDKFMIKPSLLLSDTSTAYVSVYFTSPV